MEYLQRTYRDHFRQDRWTSFLARYKETDLWIGIDKASWDQRIVTFTTENLRCLRTEMDGWIGQHTEYAKALIPCSADTDAPEIFREMSAVAEKSHIGPMSAVAGAVAKHIGEAIQKHFDIGEIIIENGGDIYANFSQPLDIAVFAGTSPLSEKVGLQVKADGFPLGICTSSGTVGPSLSFGKADAVMIICHDALLADTYATAFANLIQTKEDIYPCIEKIRQHSDILAAIAIKEDQIGICGEYNLQLF
ncbi:MAG: UPF0280 family protein [Odoribacter sp.]